MLPILKHESIIIDGVEILILWKQVKAATIRVYPDKSPQITVPRHYSIDNAKNILSERIDWIKITQQKVIEKKRNSCENRLTYELAKQFFDNFPTLLEKWEKQMNLRSSKVTLRLMKSCWGSCRSNSRALTFNLLLATKPLECVEYVIIHELAHIVYPNHSPEFWKLVAKYCPDYIRIRQSLRRFEKQE